MNKILLIDLDGTVINLNPDPQDILVIHKYIFTIANKYNIKKTENSAILTYKNILTSLSFNHRATIDCRSFLNKYENEWAKTNSSKVPDIDKFFRQALKLFDEIFIVTNNGSSCIQVLFNRGLIKKQWFQGIISRDNSEDIKPSAIPLLNALELSKSNVKRIFFIGDSCIDEQACKTVNSQGKYKISYSQVDKNLLSIFDQIQSSINL